MELLRLHCVVLDNRDWERKLTRKLHCTSISVELRLIRRGYITQ